MRAALARLRFREWSPVKRLWLPSEAVAASREEQGNDAFSGP